MGLTTSCEWVCREKAQPEIMILVSGFDETFDENVHTRYSYSLVDMVWGAKFTKVLGANSEGKPLVDLGKIDAFDVLPIDHLIVGA